MDVLFKRKVIFYLMSNLHLENNGKILLCNFDEMLHDEIRHRCVEAEIDYLNISDVDEFVVSATGGQGKNYEYILDFGLLEKCYWDSSLIRALGVNLSECGKLRYFFAAPEYISAPLMHGIKTRFDIMQRLYENWFMLGEMYGINENGQVVNIDTWCANNGGHPFYIGLAGDFDRYASWLQSAYTEEDRWELSRLLTRIEYDIDVQHSLAALKELYRKAGFDSVYLRRFVCCVAHNVDKVENLLRQAGVICDE